MEKKKKKKKKKKTLALVLLFSSIGSQPDIYGELRDLSCSSSGL